MPVDVTTRPDAEALASDFDLDVRTELRDLADGDGALQAKTVSMPHGPATSSCFCATWACPSSFC
ncbi:hypothetical protein J2Z21_008305 [Streptomyces griseochromogenes]|uniref:Uncharacterized protein n=1 Tax=Streptomyces griseochromogenes TaxID=68214 RepID=A0A1B1B0R4_9ACTN|nr:hypothetical protein [Streptomyces griseochromogenes]ANP52390.1 hypothetical protein AVL59_25175 [Streptomyces griseochromogenes]MBP2055291.1 hypothetical protein [Streptomyces griseochromogenes]